MRTVKSVKYVSGYTLLVEFDDGMVKSVDLGPHLEGTIFEPLKNREYFKTVQVSEDIGTIVWDNDADFSPEFLYEIGVDVGKPTRVG
jgi:hypothetical protein